MTEKIRVTLNNSRAGSARHNDRQFDTDRAEHIDPERMQNNWYWHCYQRQNPTMSFDAAELQFYTKHFQRTLDTQNERAISARHPERVRDMDAYRHARKTCPEESLIYLGHAGNTVDADTLRDIVREQIRWEQREFPQFKILDVALHVDEEGAPHIHRRGVWIAHDSNGNEIVGQGRALAEMGVERPNPSRPESRGNNAKMTYTAECRAHLQELCRARGIDLETTPRERSKSGRSLADYQAEQAEQRAEQARAENSRLTHENTILRQQIAQAEKRARTAERRAERAESLLNDTLEQNEIALQGLRTVLNEKALASEIKKPLFARKDDLQTYHRNMLESTRAIGDDAYTYFKKAQALQQDIARRERALQGAERTITQAREMSDNVEQYIDERARKRFELFKERVFSDVGNSRLNRLEDFCKEYSIDGKSLYDIFNQQERQLQHTMNREWERGR